jgi:hypothetical protein
VFDLAQLKYFNFFAHKHMFFEQSNFRVLGHPIENRHEVREMKIPTSALLARNNFRLARDAGVGPHFVTFRSEIE